MRQVVRVATASHVLIAWRLNASVAAAERPGYMAAQLERGTGGVLATDAAPAQLPAWRINPISSPARGSSVDSVRDSATLDDLADSSQLTDGPTLKLLLPSPWPPRS